MNKKQRGSQLRGPSVRLTSVLISRSVNSHPPRRPRLTNRQTYAESNANDLALKKGEILQTVILSPIPGANKLTEDQQNQGEKKKRAHKVLHTVQASAQIRQTTVLFVAMFPNSSVNIFFFTLSLHTRLREAATRARVFVFYALFVHGTYPNSASQQCREPER